MKLLQNTRRKNCEPTSAVYEYAVDALHDLKQKARLRKGPSLYIGRSMEDVTIHDLRRTCASCLAIEGENLPIIQNVLNHKSLAHTAIYARLNTKAVDRALQTQADRFWALQAAPAP